MLRRSYKDPAQIKLIFYFLIKQLGGLKDPKDTAFKRYFYLLENLAYVKSFNMCLDLEDCNEIFCALFSLMFKIVNDEHSGKVKTFMLDVLIPLLTKSQRKNTASLANQPSQSKTQQQPKKSTPDTVKADFEPNGDCPEVKILDPKDPKDSSSQDNQQCASVVKALAKAFGVQFFFFNETKDGNFKRSRLLFSFLLIRTFCIDWRNFLKYWVNACKSVYYKVS